MIINTGMRTDIPAFYSEWFLNRLWEGYVLVRNPYNPGQVTRYRLSPEVVDLIGFCTKNPGPMLPHMKALENYGQYWFVTITPYGKDIEPNTPDKDGVIHDFQALSRIVGVDSIGWRYDPIFLSEEYTMERHLQEFESIASRLEGYTKTCVISFIQIYPKVTLNFPEVKTVPREQHLELGEKLVQLAAKYGMTLKPCGMGDELAPYGADCSGCMTIQTYETALHRRLNAPAGLHGARKECACYLSCDIGAYNTCGHLCRYCYANYSADLVRSNMASHDPASPFLIGHSLPGDQIHEARQERWQDEQLSIFDFM